MLGEMLIAVVLISVEKLKKEGTRAGQGRPWGKSGGSSY